MGWLIALAVLAAIWAGEWFGLALLAKRVVVDEVLVPESRFTRGLLRYFTWSSLLATVAVWCFALLARATTGAWPSDGGMDFALMAWIDGNPSGGSWRLLALGVWMFLLPAFGALLVAPALPATSRRNGIAFGLREQCVMWGGFAAFAASLWADGFERALSWVID